MSREKDIVPVAGEAGWGNACERTKFPDEVRLIEIAELVEDIGPRPRRRVAAHHQRPVEANETRVALRRQPHLLGKPALKLPCAQATSRDDIVDPDLPARCDQQARGMADRLIGVATV